MIGGASLPVWNFTGGADCLLCQMQSGFQFVFCARLGISRPQGLREPLHMLAVVLEIGFHRFKYPLDCGGIQHIPFETFSSELVQAICQFPACARTACYPTDFEGAVGE